MLLVIATNIPVLLITFHTLHALHVTLGKYNQETQGYLSLLY